MTNTTKNRATLAQCIVLEGHGIEVPDNLCHTAGKHASMYVQKESKDGTVVLPFTIREGVQKTINKEASVHAVTGDLEPRKRSVEG